MKPWQINNKVSNLSRALDDSAKSETRLDINCLTEPERKLFAKVQEIIEKYAPPCSYTSSSQKHCFREKQTISLKLPRRKKKFAVLWKQVSNTSPSFKALRYSENASFSTQHRKYLHSGTPYSFIYKGAGGGIRTHERLRDRVLSPTPLTWLGDPCTNRNSVTIHLVSFNIYLPPQVFCFSVIFVEYHP